MNQKTLILGGAKSGKTSLALKLAEARCPNPVYLATAQAWDEEMRVRIQRHKEERGPAWTTLEEPVEIAAALSSHSGGGRVILVDCLTMWLNNLMSGPEAWEDVAARRSEELAGLLPGLPGGVILVANEVGLGIVPENRLARVFRDLAGALNQRLAKVCDQVVFCSAGLPLALKGPSTF